MQLNSVINLNKVFLLFEAIIKYYLAERY